jgi:hypothetical protein
MTEATFDAMREWLEDNPSARAEMCQEINSYDGSMDFADVFEDIEDAIETLDIDAVEAARKTFFGEVYNWYNAVYIDAYGNFADAGSDAQEYLENESEGYIDDIIEFIDYHGFDDFSYISDIDELEEIYLQDNGEDEEY